eukprot:CAMPEP_0117659704 /NCGR_PEP_ID=MMETSP0804-20121206/6573_1 /TAXON_ID=1074897 /ORGANISM="Tetraselmis astigmatica, Strain CCMP880" /LENGTH=193 /DNA_ID=CAMNT_0005466377 /DNA_START=863 /DNA_END=1441 /DNA_ORIENTATION=-
MNWALQALVGKVNDSDDFVSVAGDAFPAAGIGRGSAPSIHHGTRSCRVESLTEPIEHLNLLQRRQSVQPRREQEQEDETAIADSPGKGRAPNCRPPLDLPRPPKIITASRTGTQMGWIQNFRELRQTNRRQLAGPDRKGSDPSFGRACAPGRGDRSPVAAQAPDRGGFQSHHSVQESETAVWYDIVRIAVMLA